MESKSESQPSISWESHKWKVECAGFTKLNDGWSWVLVEEFIEGDLVWVHRDLITESENN
jgi:hypothetical protein